MLWANEVGESTSVRQSDGDANLVREAQAGAAGAYSELVRRYQDRIHTVRYEAVNAMLLNEFLKQHRKVVEQDATIEKLKEKASRVDILEKQLHELREAVMTLAEKK